MQWNKKLIAKDKRLTEEVYEVWWNLTENDEYPGSKIASNPNGFEKKRPRFFESGNPPTDYSKSK